MQQHTGQHVLSAAFDRLLTPGRRAFTSAPTTRRSTWRASCLPAEIARGEDEANRVVWEDRPVTIRFAGPDEAAALRLRKESKREGTLRLIDVQDFDLSACGGTHVARTGAIGIIAVAATERFRGGSSVTFLCGGRALAGYRSLRDAVAGSVRAPQRKVTLDPPRNRSVAATAMMPIAPVLATCVPPHAERSKSSETSMRRSVPSHAWIPSAAAAPRPASGPARTGSITGLNPPTRYGSLPPRLVRHLGPEDSSRARGRWSSSRRRGESSRCYRQQTIEGRGQHVLSGVLLHVIEPPASSP